MSTFSDYLDPDSDIAHYGVKGMKWGVRKTPESSSITPDGGGGGGGLPEELQDTVEEAKDALGSAFNNIREKGQDAAVSKLDKAFKGAFKDYALASIDDAVKDVGNAIARAFFEKTGQNRGISGKTKQLKREAKYRTNDAKREVRKQTARARMNVAAKGLEAYGAPAKITPLNKVKRESTITTYQGGRVTKSKHIKKSYE